MSKIPLNVTDRVASINETSGKIEKAQVVEVIDANTVAITFNAGETAVIRDRSDVFALYAVNPENVTEVTNFYLFKPKATL